MLIMGMLGGAAYAAIPALLKTRFNTNEILTSLMLVYVAQLFLDWLVRGPWRNPQGIQFSRNAPFHDTPSCRKSARLRAAHIWGFVFALVAAVAHLVHAVEDIAEGLRGRVFWARARGQGASPASHPRRWCSSPSSFPARWRACRHFRSVRRDRPAAADDLAGLRLHRHHRRIPRSAEPARHRRGGTCAGAVPISAAKRRRSRSAFRTRWCAPSRACCCSSCSAATRSSTIASASSGSAPARRSPPMECLRRS
jgi:hypothetical protein